MTKNDEPLAKPASEPAGGVREALLLIRPVIAGLIEAEYNVETWGLKGRLAKIDAALGSTRVCEVCGGDCSAANPPPSYCPERDAALSSSAGPAVGPVAWQWRMKSGGTQPVWSDWREGRHNFSAAYVKEWSIEERPLYAHPAPATVESAKPPRRDDPFRPAVDVDADDDYYPSREED